MGICQGAGQIYNPCVSFTTLCTPSSPAAAVRSPFPFNQIPAAMISPVAERFSRLRSIPPRSTVISNRTPSTPPLRHLTSTRAISRWISRPPIRTPFLVALPGPIRTIQSTNSQVLLSNSSATSPIWNTVGDWTRTIGSNLVNDFRMGWSHVTLNTGNSWDPSVGQFGNTLGIGNGNPASLDGLLANKFLQLGAHELWNSGKHPELRRPCLAVRRFGSLDAWPAHLQIWRPVLA